ncbi:MAG: O-antigen ligase family protein [Deltaproteobacteria bacterium]|nr:O-antigen ligase family protein [Deltaproteobacteria bacterium]
MTHDEKLRRLEQVEQIGIVAYAACLPISISGGQIALGVLIAAAVARVALTRRWTLRAMDVALGAFLLWTLITVPFSLDPALSMQKVGRIWIHLAWFALISAATSWVVIRRAMTALMISSAFIGVYGIAQHLFGPAVPRFLVPDVRLWQPTGGYYHAVGLFDHHLTYGNTLLICIAAGVGFFFTQHGRKRVGVGVALLLTFSGMIFSYARSVWMAFAALVAAFGYLKGRRVLAVLAGVSLTLGLLAMTVSPTLRERMGSAFKVGKNIERIYLWKTSVDMARDHPITGIGPGVYRTVVDEYREGYNVHWTTKSHAHNSFLMAAAESGWPAMALFIGIFAAAIYPLVRYMASSDGASAGYSMAAAGLAGIVAFATAGLFQHNFGDSEVAMTFWFFVAAVRRAVEFNDFSGN